MSGSFILDTNIVNALFGNDALVAKEIADTDDIYIPVIVAGELFYGGLNSGKPEQNRLIIVDFLRKV